MPPADASNAAPTPAAPAESNLEAEVAEVLSFNTETEQPQSEAAPAGPTGAPEPGGVVAAPSTSPDEPPAPAPAAPTPAPTEAAPAEPQTPPASPAAQPAPTGAPTPSLQVDEAALKTASLEAQVAALQTALEEARANKQATPQPAGTQPTPETPASESGQPQIQRYALTLPPQIREQLLSEDENVFLGAVTNIVNDLGTIVHNSVAAQMRKEVQTLLNDVAQAGTQAETVSQHASAIEAAREDYFKAFPDHKHPAVFPIIQAESAKLSTEFPNLTWGEQFRNALGARVQGVLDNLRQPAVAPEGPPVAEQPSNVPPARPAAMMPTGTRSGAAPGTAPDGSDLIMDTLGVFSEG